MTALWHAYNRALDAGLVTLWSFAAWWVPLAWILLAARAVYLWRKR